MRRDYLSRLTWAARWYLPPAEAAEVLEDYRDLIEQEPRSEEQLRREVGSPKDVVGRLVQAREYRKWLAVFAVLSACVVFPMVMARDDVYWSPLIGPVNALALCLGTGLAFLWFRRNGMRGGRLPKAVLGMLGLILLGMAWVWFWAGLVMTESWALLNAIAARIVSPRTLNGDLALEILAMGAVSVFGLVKARLGDCRWRAVYVLGLSGTILTISFYLLLTGLNFDGFIPGWWMPNFVWYVSVTLLGLLGTGMSLR